MRYLLNVPRIPQQELDTPEMVAKALVAMKLAINPATVADRIRELGEADSLPFGAVTVIGIGDRIPQPVDATPRDMHKEHVVEIIKGIDIDPSKPIDRSPVRPLSTSKMGRENIK